MPLSIVVHGLIGFLQHVFNQLPSFVINADLLHRGEIKNSVKGRSDLWLVSVGTVISVVCDGLLVWDAMYFKFLPPPPPPPSFFRFQLSLVPCHQEGYSGSGKGPGDKFCRLYKLD